MQLVIARTGLISKAFASVDTGATLGFSDRVTRWALCGSDATCVQVALVLGPRTSGTTGGGVGVCLVECDTGDTGALLHKLSQYESTGEGALLQ